MLFKSFNETKKNILNLSKHVSNLDNYLAHLPAVNKKAEPEKLLVHIELVNDTAIKLISIYKLENIIENLILNTLHELNCDNIEIGNFIKELFLASVAFHDYGKLNENFQSEKMQNSLFKKTRLSIGSQHSILSAFLYLNIYLKKLENLNVSESLMNSLAGIICAFADPILKHHSSTLVISDLDGDKCSELNRFLAFIGMNATANFWTDILKEKKYFTENIFLKQSEPFPVYALIKLTFSLLTASDYLATLSYQYEFSLPAESEYTWYGLYSSQCKAELHKQFKSSAEYNRMALDEPKVLKDIPFFQLQSISNDNLNILRSKILGEVVWNIREHSTQKLFYLNAPTGAGKTNISLAAALELLNSNADLNKIFYVFPFTTLITQTYKAVKETLNLDDNDIIQLHSRAVWHEKNYEESSDGFYGAYWENHIDNLFVQYPIVLLSHIRFFDILKSNKKEVNYLFSRLANSVVIIDELQSYSPKFWEHVNYFITNYCMTFNIRFILMSATLPEIGKLTLDDSIKWVQLIKQPEEYFLNANFSKRAMFDFSLLNTKLNGEKNEKLQQLAEFIFEKIENYAINKNGSVKCVIEFITKKSAAEFLEAAYQNKGLSKYKILMLTGTILEFRRRQIINWLKNKVWLDKHPKVLLISTQVVEAGVDIDMDIGFKDTSLMDSDEQLAGRVNRNAIKSESSVYLFHLDGEGIVYKGDERISIQRGLSEKEKQKIYEGKAFNLLYDKVIDKLVKEQTEGFHSHFRDYKEFLQKLNYKDVDQEFQLIKEGQTKSVFIPLEIPITMFSEPEQTSLEILNIVPHQEKISGAAIFKLYEDAIKNKIDDFAQSKDYMRKVQSFLNKFTISVYPQTAEQIKRQIRSVEEIERFGFIYWEDYKEFYSLEEGLKFPEYQCDFI